MATYERTDGGSVKVSLIRYGGLFSDVEFPNGHRCSIDTRDLRLTQAELEQEFARLGLLRGKRARCLTQPGLCL